MKFVFYSFLMACLVFCLAVTDGRQTKFRCDYTYYKGIGGYLKYNDVVSNWHEAQLRCHMEGATLASPLNRNLQLLMMVLPEYAAVNGIFTGIHSSFSRGDLYSIEGVPLWKINHTWAEGEPDNKDNKEGCIVMQSNGAFADASCDETFPYICYKKSTPNMIMTGCGTIDSAYTLNDKTGSCYKFHRYPRTWSRAYMTCSAEGGYLAIINSQEEATVLKEIYAKNPNIEQVGDYWRDVAFIGFHDWNEHGEWRTVHGQSLTEAGYDKFQPGEPNNATTGEYCGGMFRSGMLADIWCHRRANFICEKDPGSLLCPDEEL